MLVNPIFMLSEEKHLRSVGVLDAFERLTIEREALVTTPYHVTANRIREMARSNRHGSCGMGIGETVSSHLSFPDHDLQVGDLEDRAKVGIQLTKVRDRYLTELSHLHSPECKSRDLDCICSFKAEWNMLLSNSLHPVIRDLLNGFRQLPLQVVGSAYLQRIMKEGTTIFEGAQGVLLDQDYGFHPYTTWSDTTFGNALNLIEGFSGDIRKIGILRSYMTRHGAGPFVTEGKGVFLPTPKVEHNALNSWQQDFRLGAFDAFATQYALRVIGGVDEIAMTHCDVACLRTNEPHRICVDYLGGLGVASELRDVSWVSDIRGRFDDREKISLNLSQACPVYLEEKVNWGMFIPTIEDLLKTPITIKSFGPTAKDKR
jgi:adenylosuccinate synthase